MTTIEPAREDDAEADKLFPIFADFDQIAVRVAEIDRHHRTTSPDAFDRSEFHHHPIGRETGGFR